MIKRKNGGITLVALVITIVILIILAGISISTLTNTGIFQKAKDAKKASENAEKEQSQTLSEYEKELNKYTAQELTEDKINKVLSETENIVLKDANGNIFTLPAGFKVVVNDDTGNAKTVDKGIVIEDATDAATKGSQFVWVPVGTIIKTDGTQAEIKLNRYTFDEDGIAKAQNESVVDIYYSETESKGNTVAKSVSDFKLSVTTNGGYYIGRYEARTIKPRSDKGDTLAQITEKGTDKVYNFVTQIQAASQAKNMYNSSNFTSDLMNSYAWDTAILFLQNCGTNKKYSRQKGLSASALQTGTNTLTEINKIDKQCNIYDMAGNLREWTTEMSDVSANPCVVRGGNYCDNDFYTGYRDYGSILVSNINIVFRPILYL